MTRMDEVVSIWNALQGTFQTRTEVRHAVLGDGNGTVAIDGRPGWTWIRYEGEQSRLSQVRNIICGYYPDGTHVVVGKWLPTDKYEQVLGIWWGPYAYDSTDQRLDEYGNRPHGSTHGADGSDPVPVDYGNILFGMIVPTSPATLNVQAYRFLYGYGDEIRMYDGGTIDLSAHMPGVQGHRYVLVYFDYDTENLGAIPGPIVPPVIECEVPATDENCIPLAIVETYFGQATITNSYIYQYKLMLGSIGGTVAPHTHSGITTGGSSIIGLEELFLACHEPIFLVGNNLWPTHSYHEVYIPAMYEGLGPGLDLEADLIWIHPDPVYGCGQILILKPASPAMYTTYKINVRHGVGNIRIRSEVDVVLDDGTDHIMLIYDGQYWCDL